MNDICYMCNKTKRDHEDGPLGEKLYCGGANSSLFTPSGRVSVPVEFIEAVREFFTDPVSVSAYEKRIKKIKAMLDQMEGGGK
jgi:hypothetical protein